MYHRPKRKIILFFAAFLLFLPGCRERTGEFHQLNALLKNMETDALFAVDRRGEVVFSYGAVDRPLEIHSVRKLVLNALLGRAWGQGRLNLQAKLKDLQIQEAKEPLTPVELEATVLDLLKFRSGIAHRPAREMKVVAAQRPARGKLPPGVRWFYNNWDADVLAHIFERADGRALRDAFLADLARPLGMSSAAENGFRVVEGTESAYPAFELSMTARDLARLGMLYLNGGRWEGVELIPEKWLTMSTRTYSALGGLGGFGFLLWTAHHGRHYDKKIFPPRTFSSWGYGGQFVVMMPELDMAVVHLTRTNFDSGQGVVKHPEFVAALELLMRLRLRQRDGS